MIIPVLGAVTCLILLTQQEASTWIRAAVLILIGLVLYLLNIFLKKRAGEEIRPQRPESRVR